jgi:gluconate kinase
MIHTNLHQFQQIVLSDPALQAQLAAYTNSTELHRLVLQLAHARGYTICADELCAAARDSRFAQPWREDVISSGSWMPIALHWKDSSPSVEWCYCGTARFRDPFFDQTISKCLASPFNRLFRHQTPLDALAQYTAAHPGVPTTGLIFHMSRCGSTLIAQMLAALHQTIVLSEAEPIDAVLRAGFHNSAMTDEQRIIWLRWVVSALSQPRNGETSCVIKFDCWNTMDAPLIQRAFPAARCVFVYRDPIEVLVSHQRQRGRHMVPGLLEPELFGLDAAYVSRMRLDEYGARALACVCQAALHYAQSGRCHLINYRQLPDAVWELLDLFQIQYTAGEPERMRQVTQFHAKSPSFYFANDVAAKQQEATHLLRELARRWLTPLYQQLEASR